MFSICACSNPTQTDKSDFSRYKTEYIGDASNVVNIVSGQEYPKGYSYSYIEIQSEEEPYELSVFLEVDPSLEGMKVDLIENAEVLFELVGNLEIVYYKDVNSKKLFSFL
ncbi:MAG: DUF4825 domain-containing protein [Bacillota bacterium]|nr:DUF4825 domain-containing protein [Bacillota bacterium]